MSVFSKVVLHSEKVTGLNISDIKAFSPEQLRTHLEKRNKKRLSYVSEFPIIGRGNVLRDNFVSREDLDSEIDKILSGDYK